MLSCSSQQQQVKHTNPTFRLRQRWLQTCYNPHDATKAKKCIYWVIQILCCN